MSRIGIISGYRKIKFLQALDWWVMDMTLWSKTINVNNFSSGIISGTIAEYQFEFECKRKGKGELSNPKEFLHKNGFNGKT